MSGWSTYTRCAIDLIGGGWQDWVGRLQRPWIACNRTKAEGGKWAGDESTRTGLLLEAAGLGAWIVDVELATPDLAKVVAAVKESKAQCLLSSHNLSRTPPAAGLGGIVHRELAAGADICKVVTTATRYEDNLTVLRLFRDFPDKSGSLCDGGNGDSQPHLFTAGRRLFYLRCNRRNCCVGTWAVGLGVSKNVIRYGRGTK